jgi:serine/threonine protein kinase
MAKKDSKQSSKPDSDTSGNTDTPTSSDSPEEEPANIGTDDATVLRDTPSGDDATVILGDTSPHDDATVLRDAPSDDDATLLRDAPSDDDETLLRDAPSDDDETVLREPHSHEDETVLNPDQDDDATVLADDQNKTDSTYIAAVGTPPKRSKGSSDAGRLLKNRFVLEQKIGSGGMADVYKALDLRLQEQRERNPYVAIKLLKEEFAKHADATVSLQREASKTRGMPHKNIMAVYDFDAEGDTVFMAMELLTGEPLDDYLKQHPEGLETEVAWNLVRGICEGLIMAHSKNIVHSDFKPGNIFFTEEKTAKILDFGIARAAENPGEASGAGDETVFDAGSLGALTPTYASNEMLTGQVPTKADDVYAAALVAYEMFTGKHPYGRTPADKALERGLEAERIPFMKRRHWQALQKGMAIKNEDRTQTMEEFMEGMFSEDMPVVRYAIIGMVASAIIGYGAYTQLTEGPVQDEALIKAQTALDISKNDFRKLLTDAAFTEQWEKEIKEGLDDINSENETLVTDHSQVSDPELPVYRNRVQELYLEQVQRLRQQYEQEIDQADRERDPDNLLASSEIYLNTVKSQYNFLARDTEAQDGSLKMALRNRDSTRKTYDDQVKRDLAAREAKKTADLAKARAEKISEDNALQFQETYSALQDQMKCKRTFKDKEGMAASIGFLQQNHTQPFADVRASIVDAMKNCITKNRIKYPNDAKRSRAAVLAIFPAEKAISSIKIQARDPCAARGLAGRGTRNKKCQDQLQYGGKGPELVVIPRKPGEINKFAIGKTELKIGEYNTFCKQTGCEPLTDSDRNSYPVTNITVAQARAYLAWLSTESGRVYRLPKAAEWQWAAATDQMEAVSVNVNCTVNSRGVRLGEKLVKTLSGKPNRWGLYHHIGNAQEWADDGESLLAMGGAHTDKKKDCTIDRTTPHSGNQDAITGLRVYRKI